MIGRFLLVMGFVFLGLIWTTAHSNAASGDGKRGSSASRPHATVSRTAVRPRSISARPHGIRSYSHVRSRPTVRSTRYVRTHNNPFGEVAGGLIGDIIEEVIYQGIDAALQGPAVVYYEDAPVPVELQDELDSSGVPEFMQPHVGGLLTSYDTRRVAEGEMILMHYQLNSIAEEQPARRTSR